MVQKDLPDQAVGSFYRLLAWQTVLLIVLGWFNFRLALLGAAITAGLAWYELKYKGLQSPPASAPEDVYKRQEGRLPGITGILLPMQSICWSWVSGVFPWSRWWRHRRQPMP